MKRSAFVVLAGAASTALLVAAALVPATPASAATLVQVTNFGTNPTNLLMHLYVPDRLQSRPPILVVNHWCTGDGPTMFNGTEFRTLADQFGFIAIYPSANRSSRCFDVASPQTLRHNGGGDSLGIVSMVNYVKQNYNVDPNRVYSTGISSGGMMTNVLLGAYPDVFRGGAAFAGVPFACFATTDGSEWNTACAQGQIDRTPQEWGDLVRNAFPGYTGPWPRMQTWHGTNDDALRYPNFTEQIQQWTNVNGLSTTPTSTDSPRANWTRTRYASGGTVRVEGITIQGGPHNIYEFGMGMMAVEFLGLNNQLPGSPSSSSSRPPSPSSSSTPPLPGGCRVTYSVNAWNTGLVATITITNTSTTPVDGWALGFTLPGGQTITNGWGATYTPTSGAVTARNVSYNAAIAPNSSVTIGFQANHTGNAGSPGTFTLNGTLCSAG